MLFSAERPKVQMTPMLVWYLKCFSVGLAQDVIGSEFARTGCKEHFIETPYAVRQRLDGPAFLVYYAPALIQKAGDRKEHIAYQYRSGHNK
eukprot:1330886-Amphidinium_carterae.1